MGALGLTNTEDNERDEKEDRRMSEFTCYYCGDLMSHGECPTCGSTRAGSMDGMGRRELDARDADYDNERDKETA